MQIEALDESKKIRMIKYWLHLYICPKYGVLIYTNVPFTGQFLTFKTNYASKNILRILSFSMVVFSSKSNKNSQSYARNYLFYILSLFITCKKETKKVIFGRNWITSVIFIRSPWFLVQIEALHESKKIHVLLIPYMVYIVPDSGLGLV